MKKSISTLLFALFALFGNAQSTLIHYWHFNNFVTAMYTPDIVGIPADFSIHDTSKAKILYAEIPGTSLSYSTYIDPNPAILADYDTVNARMGQPDGNMMRPRNPVDSMRLLFYIPTVHYKNIVLKYATQSSSVAHGDTYQLFDYSIDSGATWRTSGLSELQDSAWLVMKLVNVAITDPLANDNPKLVFRVKFNGNTTLTSGNNRFDNVTVEGDSIIAVSTITTTPGTFGPFCNATTTLITVPFTTAGAFTGGFSVQLSNASGSFASGTTIIGGGASSPITAAIPAGTAPGAYRLRVISSTTIPAVYGSDNGSDIIVNGPPTAYAVTGGGTACAGGTGVAIGVANSQVGASYQLYLSGSPVGAAVTGTGSAIAISNINVAGTYFVRGSFGGSAFCTTTMTGSATVTVSPSPAAITGTMNVCAGQTVTLHDATSGGTWSSSGLLATVGASSGVVTGVASGTPSITYTAAGCTATVVITVNPLAPITGGSSICVGATTTLSDAISGGTWSAGNTNATVGPTSGIVTGVNSGTTSVIIYTTPGGCQAITTVSINTSPSAIGGATAVCASAITNLTNAATGGTWVSGTTSVATIGATGTVSGVSIGTTVISYTLSDGCATSIVVAVSPSPGPISSLPTICAGTTVSLSDAVSGGLWTSSSSSSIATIGSLTGQVSGVNPGTTTITYSLGGSSCTVTKTITVNASPLAITGVTSICSGTTTSLNDLTSGGVWSSSNTTIVSITGGGSITGTGVGISTVSYTVAGCPATTIVAVNITPVAISGPSSVCAGQSITLSDATTGGGWSSAATTISLGAGGSIAGVSAGSATISYIIGACNVTKSVVVNPVATMSGPTGVCVGSTATLVPSVPGGTWSAASTTIASVSGSGTVLGVLAGSATITYVLSTGCTTTTAVTVNTIPTAVTGVLHTCVGASTSLGDGAGGGTWSINPASRASVGLSNGSVTGISAGTALVTYSLGTGCTVFAAATIDPLPSPIGGTPQVCTGLTTALSDVTTGGAWNISNTSTASISTSGVVSGFEQGTDTVSYTIPTGCMSVAVVTVNPLPGPISVSGYVCLGLNTNLNDISYGGTWSSSNTAFATIDAGSGIVTGIGAGSPTITYTLPTTCIATLTVTVNSIAPPITGTRHVCEALTTTLGDPLPGGLWSSSDTTIAIVNSGGAVTGVSAGTLTISYVTAICPATATVTVNPIPAPIGGTTEVCEGSFVSLIESGDGTWSSTNIYLASVDPVSGVVRGQTPGVGTIIYTLDVGCTRSINVTVDPLPAPISGASDVCLGSTLSLGEVASGGVWSSINTDIATVTSSGLLTSVSDGVATISYTIASGCASTRAISVISVPAIAGVSNMCAWGSTLVLHDSIPGGSWASSSVSVSDSGVVTSAAPGVAHVTYTIPAGCSSSASIVVNPLPGPINGNRNLCVGLTTVLSDSTAGTWSTSNSSIANVGVNTGIVSGILPGTAIITFANGSGCTQATTVFVHSLPSPITGGASVCTGSSTILSETIAGGVWSSSNTLIANTSVDGSVSGLSVGVATITYNLGASCIATKDITVNPLPTPVPVTGGGSYCVGGPGLHIGTSASTTGVDYQLYYGTSPVGGAIPGTYSGLDFGLQTAPGIYSVIAMTTTTSCGSDMGGTSITIVALPALHAVTGGGSYCTGGTGVSIGLASSDFGVNYQLYNGTASSGALVAGTGSALSFGLHTGVGTYSVIATSALAGCSDHMTDSATVVVSPLVTPSINVTSALGNTLCAGTPTTFNTTTVNGGSTPTYKWTVNGSSVSASGTSYSYAPANGDVVKATLISSAACASPDTVSSSDTMIVQPLVVPSVTVSATPGATIVAGQNDTLTATVVNGGPSPIFQWKLNGNVVSGVTTATYINSGFSNGDVVTCTIISSGSCPGQTATATVTISVNGKQGISQVASFDNLKVVPNPNKGAFTISGTFGAANAGPDEEVSIEITNMLGQVVYQDRLPVVNSGINKQITIGNAVANGMYILSLRSEAGSKVFHIVIEQ